MNNKDSNEVVKYPQNPDEWRTWIENMMNVNQEQGTRFFERGVFPIDLLVKVWKKEFTIENGYSSDFIPALTRNKSGFLKWVYGGGHEPNWMKSD